jgi:hypothetical protein
MKNKYFGIALAGMLIASVHCLDCLRTDSYPWNNIPDTASDPWNNTFHTGDDHWNSTPDREGYTAESRHQCCCTIMYGAPDNSTEEEVSLYIDTGKKVASGLNSATQPCGRENL